MPLVIGPLSRPAPTYSIDAFDGRDWREHFKQVVAPVSYFEGKVVVNCYGVPCLMFKDLGLKISPLTNGKGTELSLEQLEKLNGIDLAFRSATATKTGGLQGVDDDLTGNKVWQSLGFVRDDAYVPFDMEMQYGSPSGHAAFLDVVEKALLG